MTMGEILGNAIALTMFVAVVAPLLAMLLSD